MESQDVYYATASREHLSELAQSEPILAFWLGEHGRGLISWEQALASAAASLAQECVQLRRVHLELAQKVESGGE